MVTNIERKINNNGRFTINELNNTRLDYLLRLESINIYNDSKDYNGVNYKEQDNITYLNNAFKIVKKLRNMGYDGIVNVECDSLYDISNSLFNYQSLNTCFTVTKYSMAAVNDFVNCYIYNTSSENLNNMSVKDLFKKILFFQIKELYQYIELRDNFNKEISDSIYNYIISDIVNDILKIYGAKFIKYSSDEGNLIYYFDTNTSTINKYYPCEMLDKVLSYLDKYKGFLEYDGDNELLKKDISKAFDEICKNDELDDIELYTLYDDYLSCNNLDDLYSIIYTYESEDDLRIHYIHLLNILSDLSREDYDKFIKNNDIDNIRFCIDSVFSLILEKKKELTKPKIYMSICN